MASGDLSNQVPIIPGGGYLKDSIIGGMPGPLPDSQQRHWIPDERDNFISWLRGEFAAANAIIDTLCHHLHMIGKPGEYDFVLTCIQQRRYNWTVVLHMQQYFSVAEVVFALQQVIWMKQALNSDPSGLPPLFISPENGGGPPWKEGPIIYRDPRGESLQPGTVHHNSIPEDQLHGRKETLEGPRKSDEQGDRRRNESGDQERQKQPAVSAPVPDPSSHPDRNQADLAEQGTAGIVINRNDSLLSETLSALNLTSAQRNEEAKEENVSDQGLREQDDRDRSSTTKLEGSEGPSSERDSTPYLHLSSEDEDRRLANMKITKSYSCLEQIEGKMVNTVEGLELHEKVLDKLESNRLASLIQDVRTAGKRGELGGGAFIGPKKGAKGKGRELIQFGHSHHHFVEDHKRRSYPKDDGIPPVPAFLEAVIDRLVRWHIISASKRPDCCSINIMEEGDYLPPHLDNSHLERPYYTLALQSECILILGQSMSTSVPGDFKGPFQIAVPVGAVLVFQRNSADIARHSIPSSPSKRIFITLGKVIPNRTARGYNTTTSAAGLSQSPPTPASISSSSSWGPSFNQNSNNRPGNNSNLQHNQSSRAGGGGGFPGPFKSHKYTPVASSSPSGGVLPNPTARPPPPAQIISNVANSVPPLFSGTPGPPAGGGFNPPSMPIPTWSPLPRPPPPNRPPSAGTGVFFPSSGASSGPGRPANMPTPRRSGNNISSAPPLLQKTNSAPASFASLEVAAIAAAAAAASSSTPPTRSSKSTSTAQIASSEKVSTATSTARGGLAPGVAATQDSNAATGQTPSSDPQSDANGVKSPVKEDNPVVVRSSGRSSKSPAAGSPSRVNPVNIGGGGHS